MPTYHYRCKSCTFEFEEFQKISDPPLTQCPSCGKHTVTRLLSGGAGLVFKGSGFYLTDYKRPKSDAKSETKKGGDTAPEAGKGTAPPSAPPSSGKPAGPDTK